VVDGITKEKQQLAEGISGHSVNPVFGRQTAQVSRTAFRTLAVTSEQSKERPPPVRPQAAILALIQGAIENLVKDIAGLSNNRASTGDTGWHRFMKAPLLFSIPAGAGS
jgi:hypothetical protein